MSANLGPRSSSGAHGPQGVGTGLCARVLVEDHLRLVSTGVAVVVDDEHPGGAGNQFLIGTVESVSVQHEP